MLGLFLEQIELVGISRKAPRFDCDLTCAKEPTPQATFLALAFESLFTFRKRQINDKLKRQRPNSEKSEHRICRCLIEVGFALQLLNRKSHYYPLKTLALSLREV